MLDIREVQSYVLSLKNDNEDRRTTITEKLKLLGITKWEFFDSIDVREKAPYWIGCALTHRECLVNASYPCMIYEDDIKASDWYRPIIEDPKEKILYLGVSQWGMSSGTSNLNGYVFSDYSDELCVVKHMCSAHAIYYPNREIAMKFTNGIARHIFENARPFDEHYAKMQVEEETLCLKQPLFCQDDPKTIQYTNKEIKNNKILQ